MNEVDFEKDFLENIRTEAAATGVGTCAAFVKEMADYLVNAEVMQDFMPAFYTGILTGRGSSICRIDGYYIDEIDHTLNLVIADYDGTQKRTINRSQAESSFNKLARFINGVYKSKLQDQIEESTPCYDLVDLMGTLRNDIYKYRLILFTDAVMSSSLKTIDSLSIDGIPTECQIWDIQRLYKVCSSNFGRQNIEIDFKDYTPRGIPCLEASRAITAEYNSYLCIVPGKVLADIYDKYGSQLLEGNVRSFLSTKVAVNKMIRETIIKYPSMFFAYNNGVSATALDVHLEKTSNGTFIVYAKDFQIINGGQTTASLSNARYKDKAELNDIYIQMKLIEIDEQDVDKSNNLIKNISKSSNSQNKVSEADFFSNHPFHIQFEQLSRRIYAPPMNGMQYDTKWFYERARGQYLQEQMQMTPAKRRQFILQNPKKQLITKTDLAKVRNSWNEFPYIVSKGAQTNFMKFAAETESQWEISSAQFNERYFQETIALTILFKYLEALIPQQDWYENGYRANIVTYSMALLKVLIKKKYKYLELDLIQIWNKQQISPLICKDLENITKLVYQKLINPERKTVNVTQWCKREPCWNDVMEIDYTLSDSITSLLIDNRETNQAQKKRISKLSKSVEKRKGEEDILEDALQMRPDQWKRLGEFAKRENLDPMGICKNAVRSLCSEPPERITEYQYQNLLRVLDRAQKKGFII